MRDMNITCMLTQQTLSLGEIIHSLRQSKLKILS